MASSGGGGGTFFKQELGRGRSPLLGASICAVPLSQPFPVKNYFQNRLSCENPLFPRTYM